MGIRRWFAARKRTQVTDIWPVFPGSDTPPLDWSGWPEGKKFALVLTHDVEGRGGLDKCRALIDLEKNLGFRSLFNFIPEGKYRVTEELRQDLTRNGFEVGVHDLKHDGKLYNSRRVFREQSERINEYLKEWGSRGFRSGFMLSELTWLHDLNIDYDASTFDTDPFEPRPFGTNTIFPFWVPNPEIQENGQNSSNSPLASAGLDPRTSYRRGYIELPYTLPQDSTLFLLLREKTIQIWRDKLKWIARSGGMALINTHPDYMDFDNQSHGKGLFPARLYEEFLREVKTNYAGQYWHALPKEVAAFALAQKEASLDRPSALPGQFSSTPKLKSDKKIWIDLENTPHIPFFKPIIKQLEDRGYQVVLTARDAYQTCEMATRYGFAYTRIGRHYGKRRFLKLWGIFARGFQLLPFAIREKPCLSLNHGSRTQTFISNMLRIPTVTIMDYEHTSDMPFVGPLWEIVPDVVQDENVNAKGKDRIRKYSGIKEDVYVPSFKPDPSLISELGLDRNNVLVTVRPPATEAHYHNPESEVLFTHFMNRLCGTPGVQAVLLPRNKAQETQLRSTYPSWFQESKVIIPSKVVDGLNLLWHSDLAVSGGGTMNREAAALGVPVYSIFRGKIGAVDRQLEAEGRLKLIENVTDVTEKIPLSRRPKNAVADLKPRKALTDIMEHIEGILKVHYPE